MVLVDIDNSCIHPSQGIRAGDCYLSDWIIETRTELSDHWKTLYSPEQSEVNKSV